MGDEIMIGAVAKDWASRRMTAPGSTPAGASVREGEGGVFPLLALSEVPFLSEVPTSEVCPVSRGSSGHKSSENGT
jgi:hypothetical protein